MQKKIITTICIIAVVVLTSIVFKYTQKLRNDLITAQNTQVELMRKIKYLQDNERDRIDVAVENIIQSEIEWLLLKIAICVVESRLNPLAVGRLGDGGLYQHLPLRLNGHTREANRLQDTIVFTDACRFDPLLSTKIFEIVNRHHNPNRCIERAITLHNSGGGRTYRNAVMREFEILKAIYYTID